MLVLLVSCTRPPDVPLCVEINPVKGFCVYTITDKEFIVDDENKFEGKTWWDMKPAMVLMPASSWAELKSYVIKMCKQHQDCQKDIATWERKVKAIEEPSLR